MFSHYLAAKQFPSIDINTSLKCFLGQEIKRGPSIQVEENGMECNLELCILLKNRRSSKS